jgi:hypothetical protein
MDDVKCRHKDADKWRKRHYKLCIWTPLSGAKETPQVALKTSLKVTPNVDKVDIKRTTKVANKRTTKSRLVCLCIPRYKKEKWLIVILYFILRYLILITLI